MQTELAGLLVKMAGEEALALDRDMLRERGDAHKCVL